MLRRKRNTCGVLSFTRATLCCHGDFPTHTCRTGNVVGSTGDRGTRPARVGLQITSWGGPRPLLRGTSCFSMLFPLLWKGPTAARLPHTHTQRGTWLTLRPTAASARVNPASRSCRSVSNSAVNGTERRHELVFWTNQIGPCVRVGPVLCPGGGNTPVCSAPVCSAQKLNKHEIKI